MRDRAPVQEGKAGTQITATVQTGLLQRKCACGGTPGVDGECEECREKRLSLQRSSAQPTSPSPTVPPIVHEVLGSPGQPLDAGTRTFMEPRFGHDFSQVRVHTDAKAAESARTVNALAYTVGHDVVFGQGQYAPRTGAGKRLLAHELTHVMQQNNVHSIHAKLIIGSANDQYEREADRMSEQVTTNRTIPQHLSLTHSTAGLPVLQRLLRESQPPRFAQIASSMSSSASTGCVQPREVRLVRSYALSLTDHLTGGGICAVMEALPAVGSLCPISEEVTLSAGKTCPDSLLRGDWCHEGPPFIPGKSRAHACGDVPIPPTGFGDRHSVQVRDISVLHDTSRNPGNLSSCGYSCYQRYFIQNGAAQTTLGRFRIDYELTKGVRNHQNVTNVMATKMGTIGDFPIIAEPSQHA